MVCSWLSGGLDLGRRLRLQRQRVNCCADFAAEHVVDEAVLGDSAEAAERLGGDGGAEMVAAAGVILHIRARAGYCGLDALLYVLGGGHPAPSVEDREPVHSPATDGFKPALYFGKSWS